MPSSPYRSHYPGVHIVGRPDLNNVEALDRAPRPIMSAMMRNGIGFDVPYMVELEKDLTDAISDIEKRIRKFVPRDRWDDYIGESGGLDDDESEVVEGETEDVPALQNERKEPSRIFNPNSSEQKAWFLFDILGLGDKNSLKKTPTGDRYSTDKKQLEALKKAHEIIPLFLQHGQYIKLRSTYARPLVRKVVVHPKSARCPICFHKHTESHHRIHTQLVDTRAATGRLASRRPNLQNIPIRTDLGAAIRKAFIPQPGWKLVGADYSQIELRVLAHAAKAERMIASFIAGLDLHDQTTLRMKGLKVKPQKGEAGYDEFQKTRRGAKIVNFGVVYGLSALGLMASLILEGVVDWTLDDCQAFIDLYFETNPEVLEFMREQQHRIIKYGFNWDMWGRPRLSPGVKSVHRRIVEEAKREAGNMPIQAGAGGVMKLGTARLWDVYENELGGMDGADVRPLLPVHDEIIVECAPDIADDLLSLNEREMCGVVTLRVPILADGKVMDYWIK